MALTVTNNGTQARELMFQLQGGSHGPKHTITVLPDMSNAQIPDITMAMPSLPGIQMNYFVRTGALSLYLNGTLVTIANLEAMLPATVFPAAYTTVANVTLLGQLNSSILPNLTSVEVTGVGRFALVRTQAWIPPETVNVVIYPKDVPAGISAWVLVRSGAG